MDAQSYTAQERRAANQVWAAAGAYGFEPLFLARYTDGTTDFYMNTVVGLIHKYYGDALTITLAVAKYQYIPCGNHLFMPID